MNFNFESPGKIIFGESKIDQLPVIIKSYTKRVIIITGRSENRYHSVLKDLELSGISYCIYNTNNEPYIEDVDKAVDIAKEHKADLVVGLGGGSAIDVAKAVSVMLSNDGKVLDYLEVIGDGKTLENPSYPCIAIPTTAGTGAEVTKNSVLTSKEHSRKVSMRSPFMIPDVTLVDPKLCLTVPVDVTAYTGMDALTQVIEPFISCMNNYFTDLICRDVIKIAGSALKDVFDNPDNLEARIKMSYVSLIGGLALANAKLGAVHGFAGPIGGKYNIPHGVICAILLPYVLKANLKAVKERGDSSQLERYRDLGKLLTGNPKGSEDDSVIYIKELVSKLNIKRLGDYGIVEDDIIDIVNASKDSSSMKGNTLVLTMDELKGIIRGAL